MKCHAAYKAAPKNFHKLDILSHHWGNNSGQIHGTNRRTRTAQQGTEWVCDQGFVDTLPRDMRQVRKADKEEKSPELTAWQCSKLWGSGVMPSPGDSGGQFSIFLCWATSVGADLLSCTRRDGVLRTLQ